MKKLIPLLMIAAVACNEKQTEKPADSKSAVYTKTMEYAVDLNSVFHLDLNDEDFSDASPITENLIADVLSGKLTAYDRFSNEPLSVEAARSIVQFSDTLMYFDEETGELASSEVIERDYTKEFYGFTFREQWAYNAEGTTIDRKTVGIAPRIPVYSKQGGTLRGYTSAFWVKYD